MKVIRHICLALCVIVVSSCDEVEPEYSPEVRQCVNIAGHASTYYDRITITKVRQWDIGDMRRVHLNFDYPSDASEEFAHGLIVCGYAFGANERHQADRIVRAIEVHFRGRYLSQSELQYVNTSPFTPKPEFKLNE